MLINYSWHFMRGLSLIVEMSFASDKNSIVQVHEKSFLIY